MLKDKPTTRRIQCKYLIKADMGKILHVIYNFLPRIKFT